MKTITEHTGKGVNSSDTLHNDKKMTEEQLLRYQAEAELHGVRDRLRLAEEALERFGFFRYESPLGWHPPCDKDKLSTLFKLTHDKAAMERDRDRWMEMHGDMVALNNSAQAENAKLTNERGVILEEMAMEQDMRIRMQLMLTSVLDKLKAARPEIERKDAALKAMMTFAKLQYGDSDEVFNQEYEAAKVALAPAEEGKAGSSDGVAKTLKILLTKYAAAKGAVTGQATVGITDTVESSPAPPVENHDVTADSPEKIATSMGNPIDPKPPKDSSCSVGVDDAGTVCGATKATKLFVDKYVEKYQSPKPHNPDNLTPEQVDVASGYRLLDADEIIILRGLPRWIKAIERWIGGQWNDRGWTGGGALATYRAKLTREELRKARGLDGKEAR